MSPSGGALSCQQQRGRFASSRAAIALLSSRRTGRQSDPRTTLHLPPKPDQLSPTLHGAHWPSHPSSRQAICSLEPPTTSRELLERPQASSTSSPPIQSPFWLPGCPEELAWGIPIQPSLSRDLQLLSYLPRTARGLVLAPRVTKMPHQVAMKGMPSLFLWSVTPRPHSYALVSLLCPCGLVKLFAPSEVTRRHAEGFLFVLRWATLAVS